MPSIFGVVDRGDFQIGNDGRVIDVRDRNIEGGRIGSSRSIIDTERERIRRGLAAVVVVTDTAQIDVFLGKRVVDAQQNTVE